MKTISIVLLYCDIFSVAIEDCNHCQSLTMTAREIKLAAIEWLNDGFNLMYDHKEIII